MQEAFAMLLGVVYTHDRGNLGYEICLFIMFLISSGAKGNAKNHKRVGIGPIGPF